MFHVVIGLHSHEVKDSILFILSDKSLWIEPLLLQFSDRFFDTIQSLRDDLHGRSVGEPHIVVGTEGVPGNAHPRTSLR